MNKPPIRKTTQSEHIKTALRLPANLHATIHAAAERNVRSLNAEIIYRLQQEPLEELKRQNSEILSLLRMLLDRT